MGRRRKRQTGRFDDAVRRGRRRAGAGLGQELQLPACPDASNCAHPGHRARQQQVVGRPSTAVSRQFLYHFLFKKQSSVRSFEYPYIKKTKKTTWLRWGAKKKKKKHRVSSALHPGGSRMQRSNAPLIREPPAVPSRSPAGPGSSAAIGAGSARGGRGTGAGAGSSRAGGSAAIPDAIPCRIGQSDPAAWEGRDPSAPGVGDGGSGVHVARCSRCGVSRASVAFGARPAARGGVRVHGRITEMGAG
jgi:hypothetical protein